MKFSYNWLRELTGTTVSAHELGRLITMKTAESEGVEKYAPQLAEVAVARVLEVDEIPESHNRKVVVEAGRYGKRTVLCGAPNCRPGITTVYWPVGRKVIEGIESDGMLASGQELNINRDHTGIIELPGDSFDLKPDWIIEIDNKSLTHRPDLWGHHGMAREAAAITGGTLKDPIKPVDLSAPAVVKVAIEDYALCPRYSALVFENVTVQPSPLWLQYRLEAIGLNPINNIVDVTNLVMAELAQPMHAFDAEKLKGGTIHVRTARGGERILALNAETYELTPTNLVIADESAPIAIAGVIGGNDSAISASTKRIVFESANFQAASVRKTSVALRLRTDASMRFEKSLDPLNTVRGLQRAVELLGEVSPGIRVVGGLADAYRPKPAPAPIALPLNWLERKLGCHVPEEQVRRILESLGFGVEASAEGELRVIVPSWRATKDISIKDDLVEEVGRIIGYDNIAPAPPLVAASVPPVNDERLFQHRVRDLMADSGFAEVYNYSFVSDAMAVEFGFDPAAHVRVANPIAADQNLMRASLIPGIVHNIRENTKHFECFRLFEIGHEIHKSAEGLPDEVAHLIAVIYSKDRDSGLFELKRIAEMLHPGAMTRQAEARSYEHPARTGEIGGLGRLFELHPSFLETGRAAVLDIDLRALYARRPAPVRYQPIRRFPTSAFDLSAITSERTPVGEIEIHIRQAAELVSLEYLGQYMGAPLADGQKSVSFRLTVGAPDRTLSSEEITAMRSRVIEHLQRLGYTFR